MTNSWFDADMRLKPWGPLLVVVLLILAVAALSVMQVHWISRVSKAERERMERQLESGLMSVATNFDRELTGLFHDVLRAARDTSDAARCLEILSQWQSRARFPELVETAYVVIETDGGLDVEQLDLVNQRVLSASLPQPVQRLWAKHSSANPLRPVEPSIPMLVVPIATATSGTAEGLLGQGSDRRGGPRIAVILNADAAVEAIDVLCQTFLNPVEPPQYIWALDNALTGASISVSGARPDRDPEGKARVLGLRPMGEFRRMFQRPGRRGHHDQQVHGPPPEWAAPPATNSAWNLSVWHRHGDFNQVMRHWKTRHLVLVSAITLVLVLALALAITGALRVRALAQRQLRFTAGITHELMTPLAAIRSASQNLLDGIVHDDAGVRRYGRMLLKEELRLTELVEEVLSFSQLQTHATPDLEAVSLTEMVREALDAHQTGLANREMDVRVDCDPSIRVVAHRESFVRALGNLVSNAVKYAGDGVRLEISAEPEGDDVRVCVRDHGEGFNKDDLKTIFEPFRRGVNAREGQVRGVGLGLYLTRQLLRAQSASIVASNRDGACLTIRIKRARGEA